MITMKLVKYFPENNVISSNINEDQAFEFVSRLKLTNKKSIYEFARGIDNDGILNVIYKENRVFRTKNVWYEKRAISVLSKLHNYDFYHSYKLEWKGFDTEIDAISLDKKIAVEIKRKKLNNKNIDFLEEKAYSLGFEKLIIIAPKFNSVNKKDNTQLFQFRPSYLPILRYYNNEYIVWKTFWKNSAQRHFRFLLANGRWKPQRRRYTNTSKWQAANRLIKEINYYHHKYVNPIKIYYSLSRHIGPLNEFEGKGYPISRYIAAFDIDGEHLGNHIIGDVGYCENCRKDAINKKNAFLKYLNKNGFEFEVFNSGAKGYHIYLTRNKEILELGQEEMENIIKDNLDYVDSFLSKKTQEFDQHRIFKVPYTVDGSTGYIVSNEEKKIIFDDELVKL